MNIVIIGCSFDEAVAACQLTVSKVSKEGHHMYFLIASDNFGVNSNKQKYHHLELLKHSIAEVFFLKGFDYSAISQANADAILSCIKKVKPSMVIIPHWKSPNSHKRILARTSLIACRGIGSILMYDPDLHDSRISPTVLLAAGIESLSIMEKNADTRMQAEEAHSKQDRIANDYPDMNRALLSSTITTAVDLKHESQSSAVRSEREQQVTPEQDSQSDLGNRAHYERFESHRILMLEGDGIF
jgi:hypothetical protein